MHQKLQNGKKLYDTIGNEIHAHGGHMLCEKGTYYWYGETRIDDVYVNCYSSKDLINWEFRNHVLKQSSPTLPTRVKSDLSLINTNGKRILLERPKVVYNELTKKYVMWVHYENGVDYSCAAAAIATCDTPDGDFIYHGHFNPFGEMSRDCTLYVDDDKTAYFISSSRDNADMHIYRLQSDYLNVDKLVNNLWSNEYREAPAIFKKDGSYFMLSSYCTGWLPNQSKYSVGNKLDGNFTMLKNFADETTYHSQPAFVLKLSGKEETSYLYVGDRWDENNFSNSTYIFLPLKITDDNTVKMYYNNEASINIVTGKII